MCALLCLSVCHLRILRFIVCVYAFLCLSVCLSLENTEISTLALPSMLIVCMYTFLCLSVPQPHGLIVTAREDESAVRGEPGAANPIAMTTQCELELLPMYCPYLQPEDQVRAPNTKNKTEPQSSVSNR